MSEAADGAAGLTLVAAIAEAAVRSESGDIGKRGVYALGTCPQLQFAKAGSIDQQPAAGRHKQFAANRGVAAAGVVDADILHALLFTTEQAIYDRRFTGA